MPERAFACKGNCSETGDEQGQGRSHVGQEISILPTSGGLPSLDCSCLRSALVLNSSSKLLIPDETRRGECRQWTAVLKGQGWCKVPAIRCRDVCDLWLLSEVWAAVCSRPNLLSSPAFSGVPTQPVQFPATFLALSVFLILVSPVHYKSLPGPTCDRAKTQAETRGKPGGDRESEPGTNLSCPMK